MIWVVPMMFILALYRPLLNVMMAFSATCWRRVVEPEAFSERLKVTSARPSPRVMALPRAGVKFGLLETAEAVSVPRRIVRFEPVKAEEPRRRTVPVRASLSMTRLLPAMVPSRTSVWPVAAPMEEGAVRVMPRLAASVTPAVA